MRCPYCQHDDSKVLDTSHDSHGGIRRRRECLKCGQRFSSYERPILATPLLVKQDGTREEFDREKLARGVRIACAKRPVSAADIPGAGAEWFRNGRLRTLPFQRHGTEAGGGMDGFFAARFHRR